MSRVPAARQRGQYQRARRFLSRAFENDLGVEQLPAVRTLQLSAKGLAMAGGRQAMALQFSLFDVAERCVVGIPCRRSAAVPADLATPLLLGVPKGTHRLVVEALAPSPDGERCLAWWSISAEPCVERAVELFPGAGSVLQLEERQWPQRGAPSGTVNLSLQGVAAAVATVPAGVFVTKAEMDLTQPCRTFRLTVRRLKLTVRPEAAVDGATYSVAAMAHNGYQAVGPVEECSVLFNGMQGFARGEVTLGRVPLHSTSHLVLVLRVRRPGADRSVAVAATAFPLCPNVAAVRDADFTVQNACFLRGPFGCADHRCSVPSSGDGWFAQSPYDFGAVLAFDGTPRPALRRLLPKEQGPAAVPDTPDAAAPEADPSAQPRAVAPAATPATEVEPAVVTAGDARQEAPVAAPDLDTPAHVAPVPPATVVPPPRMHTVPLVPEMPAVPSELTEANQLLFRQLRELSDEVRRLTQHLTAPEAPPAPTPEPPTDLEVVDLGGRRVGLSRVARMKLTAAAQPFQHPVTKARLDPGAGLTTQPFAKDAYALRLDGVTVPHGRPELPSILEARFSLGACPEHRVGPLKLRHCCDDATLGRTYHVHDSQYDGGLWTQPDPAAAAPEPGTTLHLVLVDAVSHFYAATAQVPLSAFQRPRNSRHHEVQLDVPLQFDVTAAGGTLLEGNAHPALDVRAHLHLTLCTIGLPAPTPEPSAAAALAAAKKRGATYIDVPRIRDPLLAMDQNSPSPSPAPVELPEAGGALDHLVPGQRHLHLERARFAKEVLLQRQLPVPAAPGTVQDALKDATARRVERVEMDFRTKLVEKRRAEVKAERITERLRDRLHVSRSVTLPRGQPARVEAVFENPFPATVVYRVEPQPVPAGCECEVRLAEGSESPVALQPKATLTVALHVLHTGTALGTAPPLTVHVVREHGELMRVITIHPTLAPPPVHRRYTLHGEPGAVVDRSLFVRNFAPQELDAAAEKTIHTLSLMAANLCLTPLATEAIVSGTTAVQLNHFAQGCMSLWETVRLQVRIPTDGEQASHLFLYRDASRERLYEVWELTAAPCFTTPKVPVFCGQTNRFAVDVGCDQVFTNTPFAKAQPRSTPSGAEAVALVVKPPAPGEHVVQLNCFRAGVLSRHEVTVVAEYPRPTFESQVHIATEDAALPLARRMLVRNDATEPRALHIETTYSAHITVLPKTLVLEPQQQAYVTLRMQGLVGGGPGGQQPLQYPVRVFINDDEDVTVDSHLFDVRVGAPPVLLPSP